MTLLLLKYCVPSLLGYALFVGVSGYLNPFLRPSRVHERDSWIIGVCTGLSITLVLVLWLHMAYAMSGNGVRRLINPSTWLLLTLMVPAAIAYTMSRFARRHTAAGSLPQRMDLALETPLFKLDTHEFHQVPKPTIPHQHTVDADGEAAQESGDLVATFLDSAQLTLVDTHTSSLAINDESLDQTSSDTHLLEVELAALATRLEETTEQLCRETSLRQEAETHLRILRKALYATDQEQFRQREAQVDIHLELETEAELLATKRMLIQAREALRVNSRSRVKALDTARRASQLARYSNAARRKLECQLDKRQRATSPPDADVSQVPITVESHRQDLSDNRVPVTADALSSQPTEADDPGSSQRISTGARTRLLGKHTRNTPD